jgi:hypothetical protein
MAAYPDVKVTFVRDGTTKIMAKLEAELAAGIHTGRRAADRRQCDHGRAQGPRSFDGACRRRCVRLSGWNPRRRQDLVRHQADHHRHHVQHCRDDGSVVLDRPAQGRGQGSARHAFATYFGCGTDSHRHAGGQSGSRLGLLRRVWPPTGRRPLAAMAACSSRLPAARSSTAWSSISCRSAKRRRARRSSSYFPDEGVSAISEPVAILASTQNADAAKAFVDFLISKQGQELALSQGYLPAHPEVDVPAGFPDRSTIKVMPFDAAKALAEAETNTARFADSLWPVRQHG